MKHAIVICIALLILVACSGPLAVKGMGPDKDFIALSVLPDGNDGRLVTLRGWVSMRHEDWNLWATQSDHENWNTVRCISLSNYDELRGHAREFDGRFVEITGTLIKDATNGGKLVRLGSCREVAISLDGLGSIRIVSEEGSGN